MREILFRGKRLDNGKWVEGGSIIHFDPENDQELVFMPHMHEGCTSTHDNDDNITAFESGMFYKVDPATVGQYTGLTDKNGKKIFEGDIVCIWTDYDDDEPIKKYRAIIEFGNPNCEYSWGWQLNMIDRMAANNDILLWVEMEDAGAFCEIIGNIHDTLG